MKPFIIDPSATWSVSTWINAVRPEASAVAAPVARYLRWKLNPAIDPSELTFRISLPVASRADGEG